MNDYSEQYRQKLTDAASLAARVESGWVIGMDAATAHTPAIMSALAARAAQGELRDVKVQTLLDVYPLEFYADKSLDGKINAGPERPSTPALRTSSRTTTATSPA